MSHNGYFVRYLTDRRDRGVGYFVPQNSARAESHSKYTDLPNPIFRSLILSFLFLSYFFPAPPQTHPTIIDPIIDPLLISLSFYHLNPKHNNSHTYLIFIVTRYRFAIDPQPLKDHSKTTSKILTPSSHQTSHFILFPIYILTPL